MAWGVNKGLLDRPTYEPVIRKAWSAMVKNVSADGSVLRVQDVGAAPGPAPSRRRQRPTPKAHFVWPGTSCMKCSRIPGPFLVGKVSIKTQSPGKIGVIIVANGIASIELPENATGAALYDFRGRLLYKVHAFPRFGQCAARGKNKKVTHLSSGFFSTNDLFTELGRCCEREIAVTENPGNVTVALIGTAIAVMFLHAPASRL